MIDPRSEVLIRAARAFARRANAVREHRVKVRFGGAAGPIKFAKRLRRGKDGLEDIYYPLGLPLRTSARLEPHAPAGCLLFDEDFYKYGIQNSSDATLYGMAEEIANGIDKISAEHVSKVDNQVIDTLEYDSTHQSFSVKKNDNDPSIETPLWVIKLIDY
jgi:hypothetical protein